MADFRLQIVTAQKAVFDGMVTALTLPGEEGYFGILANHAPIVGALAEGPMTIRRGQKEDYVQITGGFVEMSDNVCTLLVDDLTGLESVVGTIKDED